MLQAFVAKNLKQYKNSTLILIHHLDSFVMFQHDGHQPILWLHVPYIFVRCVYNFQLVILIFFFKFSTGYWYLYVKAPWYNKLQAKCRRLDSSWSICKDSWGIVFFYCLCHNLQIFVLRYLMHFNRSYQVKRHQHFVKHFHHFREWLQSGNNIKKKCQNMPYLLRLVF